MATIKQVQEGFARFVDNNVACAFEGWKKYAVSGGAALLANNIPNLISAYPALTALGIYNPETGTVDVESLHKAFVARLGNEKNPHKHHAERNHSAWQGRPGSPYPIYQGGIT